MGFVNDMFGTEDSVSAAFYSRSRTKTSGDVGEWVETLSMTKDVLFWKGGLSKNLISEQDQVKIDAVIMIDPEDYTSTVSDNDVVIINSRKYSVIHADDIAEQGEAIMIPLKIFNRST